MSLLSDLKEGLADLAMDHDSVESLCTALKRDEHGQFVVTSCGKCPPTEDPEVIKIFSEVKEAFDEYPGEECYVDNAEVVLLIERYPEKLLPKRLWPKKDAPKPPSYDELQKRIAGALGLLEKGLEKVQSGKSSIADVVQAIAILKGKAPS